MTTDRLPLSIRLRLAAKAVTPPIVWTALKAAKDARNSGTSQRRARDVPETFQRQLGHVSEPTQRPEWEFVPEGWARDVPGWDVAAIAAAYREKWPSFLAAVEGDGPLGVNHEVPTGVAVPRNDRDAQHTILAFGWVLALAAGGRDTLSVLDWGGGPGHYAVLADALLPGVELDYTSRDLPALVALGRELQPERAFADDESPLDRRYDLVVASSSLHYEQDWRARLRDLAAVADRYVYVTRVPVALEAPSFVVLQRAYAYGYETEYLGWVIARDELLAEARAAGLRLARELVLPARFAADGAPEAPVEHRGYLFATTW
jgi:putative methyltransferase (TIGR04325 family)